MTCIDNTDYEDCLSVGKAYEVELEELQGGIMYKVIDDNGEFLQTMIRRFKK